MNSTQSNTAQEPIEEVLRSIRERGVRLWSTDGQLRYRAPKGTLTRDEIDGLRARSKQIVAALEDANEGRKSCVGHAVVSDHFPLSPSQFTHWRLYRLSEAPVMRQVASATRLNGRIDITALRASVAEMIHRHEALRARIVIRDGIPRQQIAASGSCELDVLDITGIPEGTRDMEVERRIQEFILEAVDVTLGPLVGMRLLRMSEQEHVLIVAMEHIISDGFSLNILTRDLLAAYVQLMNGARVSLPPIPVQFVDYVAWQRNMLAELRKQDGCRDDSRLSGAQAIRFPRNGISVSGGEHNWAAVRIVFGQELKAQLCDWSRFMRTTLSMTVFTVFAALVMRWGNVADAIVPYTSDGRTSRKLENTIGYFATTLYPRVRLSKHDTFVDLLRRVTDAYCEAYENPVLMPWGPEENDPPFTKNPCFNWAPQGTLKIDLSGFRCPHHALTCSTVRFAYPMQRGFEIDSEPTVLLFDDEDVIVGDVYFPLARFSMSRMEKFAGDLLGFAGALASGPQKRVSDVPITLECG